jgi:UDP-glucose:(heptosyl)LPS alpha-1,3-glucosyltransferase
MKLALIRRQFSATGGAELYLQRLLGALAQAGHELHLFSETWTQKPPGVTLHPVSVTGSRATRALAFATHTRALLRVESFDCVFSLERTLQQDVYRAGDGLHRVWLERRREYAPWWRKPLVGIGAFHRTMMELEARTFDPATTRHVIVNSEMVRREIQRHFSFPAERIHLVRNGIDVARFQRGDRAVTRARLGIEQDEFLLLFVGSGWERKGLKYLLQAVEQLATTAPAGLDPAKLKLLVVGKGTPPAPVPANVIFAGPLSDVESAFAAADLFVFLPIYEPSANVIFEARAAGLPVVTTAQNGAGEVLREGIDGTVVTRPDDLAAVTAAIAHWWRLPGRVPAADTGALDLNRNVTETLAVLEIAAREA